MLRENRNSALNRSRIRADLAILQLGGWRGGDVLDGDAEISSWLCGARSGEWQKSGFSYPTNTMYVQRLFCTLPAQ
jgi:hypothetical protein